MIKIKILGTAANWSKPFRSKNIKNFTSCFFKTDSLFQIDVGNKWQKQKIDYILITHLHKDHIKEIKTYPLNVTFLIPSKTFKKILTHKAVYTIFKQVIRIRKTKIEAFSVKHSRNTLTFGYRISYLKQSFIWLPDFFAFRNYRYLKNSDIWFIDGSSFKRDIYNRNRIGAHCSVFNFLKECNQKNIVPKQKKVYLIHLGLSMFPLKEKIKRLQDYFPNYIIEATKDGEAIRI